MNKKNLNEEEVSRTVINGETVNKSELSQKEQKRLLREEKRAAKKNAKAAKPATSKKKRIVALVLALALTASVTTVCLLNMDAISGFFSSLFSSEETNSGYCGSEETNDVVRWELSDSGELTISGEGEMQSYEKFEDAPWASLADDVKTVSIGEKIEWVSITGFSGFKNLEAFRVDAGNAYYAVGSAALYSADFATLYLYPDAAKALNHTVVSGTKHIFDAAFSGNAYIETISLPSSLLTIGKDAFASCEKLKTVVYAGNAAEWEVLSQGLTLGEKITVKLEDASGGEGSGAISGLKAEHFYEYLATSADVTRGSLATLLSDGSTIYLKAGKADAYLEVTIPCEKPGVYGLTMKEYHGVGRLSYMTLVNRSVTYWSDITSGNRYTELASDIPPANQYTSEDYAVPDAILTGEYTEYYAYTYLKAGLNRIRIALRSGGSNKDYDIGINSFRFDLLSADTANTETVFATDPSVIDYFVAGEGVGRNSAGTGSFYRTSGSFDVNINIKKEATYDVYLMSSGTLTTFSMTKNGGDQILSGAKLTAGMGSTSLVPLHLGSTKLDTGAQTLTLKFTGSFLNFGAIRFVPQGEDPLASQTVEGFPEMSVGEGEIDLMPQTTPLGSSSLADGVFNLRSGVNNALQATVFVEKAGVYALRLRGAFAGEYFLRNTTVGDLASLFASASADASLGWQIAEDGYGNCTVYQYLSAGENTLEFWSSASATVEGMKLVSLSEDAPSLILLSTNTAGSTASASKEYYWTKLLKDDTLTYEFRVTEDGEYLLSGLVGGAAAKVTVLDATGATVKELVYDPASNTDITVGIMGNANAVIYAEMTNVTLTAGEYKIVVTGTTAAASHYSQLYLTKKGSAESGIVWANIDFEPLVVPFPSDVKDAVDLKETEVKKGSKSGIALNGSLLIYGGSANGVYFNVTASESGFYQLEFATVGRNMSTTYARLYNPAVTGEMSSTNRDPYLGEKRDAAGYSSYGYYVYLQKGENRIYFEHDGGANGYFEVVAARIYKVIGDTYAAFLHPIKDKSTTKTFGGGGYVAQLRAAGYQGLTQNQRVVYEYTPTVSGSYRIGLFIAGSANINLRVYEGTGDGKQNISELLSGDSKFVTKFSAGVLFTVADATKATPSHLHDGSNYTTTFAPGIATVILEKGKTYTFELECGDKSSYLNAGAMTLAYSIDQGVAPTYTYPKLSVDEESLKSDNLLSVPDSVLPDNIYDGEMVDQLIAKPEIEGDDMILSVKEGKIVPGNGSYFVSDSYGIMMRPEAIVTATVEKTGIYKIIVSAFTKEDVLLTATANGASTMLTCAGDKTTAANGDNASDRSYYETYVYLTEGENKITLSARNVVIYAALLRGVEEVDIPVAHRNFIVGSPLPDNGHRPEGYYVLREGDSVAIKEAYVRADVGFTWVSAFVGGEGYLTYTFKNLDNGEVTSVAYDLTKALEGQTIGDMDLTYASFGYVNLSEGRYTVSVTLSKGSYALITTTFLAGEKHTHIYDVVMSVEPTCHEDGAIWNECFCGAVDSESYTVVPATNTHDYDETVVGKAPTCVDKGYYIKVCRICGDIVPDFMAEIDATGIHEYSEWAVIEPTLTEEGSAERHCIHCEEAETRKIARKQSRYETISIEVDTLTLEKSNKVLKFTCSVSKAGFYQIRMNTLLTPSAGKDNETYITAVGSAAPGYSSYGKSFLNEDKTAYEFSTGLSVYLAAGENTVTLTAEGAFNAAITELTLVNQSAGIDAWALSNEVMNFGANYSGNKEAVASVTIAESGFYQIGYLMGMGGKSTLNFRFDKNGETALAYSFTVTDVLSLLPEGITAVAGSTNATQYIESGYIYLESGEYTVTMTPEFASYFCYAGMTFTFADPIPSVDTEGGNELA